MKHITLSVLLATSLLAASAHADLLIRSDGGILDGKILSHDKSEFVLQPDGATAPSQSVHVDRSALARVIYTDDHGAITSETPPASDTPIKPNYTWTAPPEPAAPPVLPNRMLRPTYCVFSLKGEIGATITAAILEKSLADAALRKPTAVILDFNSPGGQPAEAQKLITVLHDYNKKLKIVALVEQDLSVAAIFSLAVKEIYIKPTGAIGATRGAVPNAIWPSPKSDDKFDPSWRAIARNAADEGSHSAVFGDALIDPDLDLHLELADGKKLIKSGPGKQMILKKGQPFALSSREAVDCGLAVNQAESVKDLLQILNLNNALELACLGTLLGDYQLKRQDAFNIELKIISDQLDNHLQTARGSDPSGTHAKSFPWRSGPTAVAPAPVKPPALTAADKAQWKDRSLAAVIALQKSEQDFKDAIALADAFGRPATGDLARQALADLGAIRAKIFDDRDKYGNHLPPPSKIKTLPTTAPK